MRKYEKMGMYELQARVLDKYKEVLKSDKLVFVVSKNHYFGDDYGAFDSNTILSFTREDLEILLSNKFSALRYLETENLIVLHDGHACFVCADIQDDSDDYPIWTGKQRKNKMDGEIEKELIYGKGSWTWYFQECYEPQEYRDIVESKISNIITEVNSTTGKDYTEEIRKHYESLLENGTPEYYKGVINDKKYLILLSNTSEDRHDKVRCNIKYLYNYCLPTLIIHKKDENLSDLEFRYLSLNQLSENKQKEYIEKINKAILKYLDTNELVIHNSSPKSFKCNWWSYNINFRYLHPDNHGNCEVEYKISNSHYCDWFAFKRKVTSFEGYYFMDELIENVNEARKSLHDFFVRQKIDNYKFKTELIIHLVNSVTDSNTFLKNDKESIMNLFR